MFKQLASLTLTSIVNVSVVTEAVHPNFISQRLNNRSEELVALSNSDIAGTCWKLPKNTYPNVILAEYNFKSDGSYEETLIGGNSGTIMGTFIGQWRISSGILMTKAIYVTVGFHSPVVNDNPEWRESFIMRNGQLIHKSGEVYIPCEAW